MAFYIFRKADGVHLYTAANAGKLPGVTADALRNEGAVVDDFVIVEGGPPQSGMVPSLNPGDQLVFIPNPKRAVRASVKAGLVVKLRGLGLNDAEIGLMV